MGMMCKRNVCAFLLGVFFFTNFSATGFAGERDIDDKIKQQEAILHELNQEKARQREEEMASSLEELKKQVEKIEQNTGRYDAEGALSALSAQIQRMQKELDQQRDFQDRLLKQLEKQMDSLNGQVSQKEAAVYAAPATKQYLVNPGPSPAVGYTQDAINAQGDSTMVFAYAPNQLYKIYCRAGYLTDVSFKKGEKITYVGGGDTAKWMIDTAEADGVPHLYIKPIQPDATTNLIVNTSRHTYQILCNAGDWYNPMIKWSYSSEEQLANRAQAKKDEQIYTAKMNVAHPEQLNFNYQITGKAKWKPAMVFDDGEKTYIQFDKKVKNKLPVLFIREENKKEISLVNYKIKGDYYIVEKLFAEAELRLSDKDTVKIERK